MYYSIELEINVLTGYSFIYGEERVKIGGISMGNPEAGQIFTEATTDGVEKVELDLTECRERLFDGSADEYFAAIGEFPVEGLLEAAGDERLWPELSETEQTGLKALLLEYIQQNDYILECDETHCVVKPK